MSQAGSPAPADRSAPAAWSLAAATGGALLLTALLGGLLAEAPLRALVVFVSPGVLLARSAPVVTVLLLRRAQPIALILAPVLAVLALGVLRPVPVYLTLPTALAVATLTALVTRWARAESSERRMTPGQAVRVRWSVLVIGVVLTPMPIAALLLSSTNMPGALPAAKLLDGVVGPLGLAITVGWVCAYGTDAVLSRLMRRPAARRRRDASVRNGSGRQPVGQDEEQHEEVAQAIGDTGRRYAVDGAAMDDLALTSVVAELARVPQPERTDDWVARFLAALWNASVAIPDEPIFRGPDGYFYLRLQLPPPGEPFSANCLSRQAAHLLAQTCGAAVYADAQASEPIYVLTMGEIESMLLFDDHRGDPQDLAEIAAHGGTTSAIPAGEQLLIGAPARAFLTPAQARGLHEQMVHGWGIAEPRIGLLVSPSAAPTRSLILSAMRDALPRSEEVAQARLRALTWYLPRSRAIVLRPTSMRLDELVMLKDYLDTVS